MPESAACSIALAKVSASRQRFRFVQRFFRRLLWPHRELDCLMWSSASQVLSGS